eukprot:CAMPEP_0183482852 /NCGR_PEP_ID=MMETSP0370-20130417/177376_1 /TAXON_ID=268820 /ORGANISM="Peridinium aciculiferum, Strain PAER-2" /LENGTH=82 /DNA_ID=CAMNT_0025676067 /DNA_START=36 /DNA_END=281 /DNA_ORIENTATION=-
MNSFGTDIFGDTLGFAGVMPRCFLFTEQRCKSYFSRLVGLLSTEYAELISRIISSALFRSAGFLSGCHLSTNFLYDFLMTSS